MVDYSVTNSRMAYMESFEELTILPVLNRNCLNFMGLTDKDDYIATRQYRGKFVALTRECELFTWSMKTGQFLSKHHVTGHDWSEYECYEGDDDDMSY